jgi:hypothetical protein
MYFSSSPNYFLGFDSGTLKRPENWPLNRRHRKVSRSELHCFPPLLFIVKIQEENIGK